MCFTNNNQATTLIIQAHLRLKLKCSNIFLEVSFQGTTLKTNLVEDLSNSTLLLSIETDFIFLLDDLVASLGFLKSWSVLPYLMLNALFCVEFFSPVFTGCLEFRRSVRQTGFFFIVATNAFKQVDNKGLLRNLKKVSDGQSINFGWIIHWQLMARSWNLYIKKKRPRIYV